jgi:hypothetical protein
LINAELAKNRPYQGDMGRFRDTLPQPASGA